MHLCKSEELEFCVFESALDMYLQYTCCITFRSLLMNSCGPCKCACVGVSVSTVLFEALHWVLIVKVWVCIISNSNMAKDKGIKMLKRGHMTLLKITLFCVMQCLCGLRFKKHIIFHIRYIIVAPLCPAFLKRVDFYRAHHSEKRSVLWLASYPVCCDWPNSSKTEMLCLLSYLETHSVSMTWWQRNNTKARIKLSSFFA